MDRTENSALSAHARELRNHMTKEERHLWYDCFKKQAIVFHRQKIIGSYIVNFYCPCAKLVVELDGSQHTTPEGMAADARRDAFLNSLGLTVKRYTNTDVHLRFAAVCEDILECIRNAGIPHPALRATFPWKGKALRLANSAFAAVMGQRVDEKVCGAGW